MTVRRFLSGTGRVLITLGLLILLFVGFELWGTNVLAARAQNDLKSELCEKLGESPGQCGADLSGSRESKRAARTTPTTKPKVTQLPAFQLGDPLGRIQIPDARNVDRVFVVGTDREQLNLGPGHYTNTPMPGQRGNAAIAGHRTTHGAPFFYLDEVQVKGDPANTKPKKAGSGIFIETFTGTYVYEVIDKRIVQPTETWVAAAVDAPIDPSKPQTRTNWMTELLSRPNDGSGPPPIAIKKNGAFLTLTSCNPRYSARERIVVFARLAKGIPTDAKLPGGKKTLSELPGNRTNPDDAFAGDPAARVPAGVWGFGTLLVGLAWWWGYRRWRHPATWFVGVVPFLSVLAVCFFYLERSLPSGY